MVQGIKELSAQLQGDAFIEFGALDDGQVQVVQARPAERVAAHGAEAAPIWRRHDRVAHRVTPKGHHLARYSVCHARGIVDGIGWILWTPWIGWRRRARQKIRNAFRRGLEIEGIPEEVPAVAVLSGEADIVAVQEAVVDIPRSTGLNRQD